MEENKNKTAKGISITMILLAIVIGFGFLIGFTQVYSGGKSDKPPAVEMEGIENYFFDDEGRFIYFMDDGTSWDVHVDIPWTYSLTATPVDMSVKNSSVSELVALADKLKLKTFTITNVSYYDNSSGYEYYRTMYQMDFKFRKTIVGNDYTTTIIGPDIFRNTSRYTSFTFPNTVKTFEYGTASGCHGEKEIIIPEGVETLVGATFYYNSELRSISLPNTLKYIGSQCFENCEKIEEVVLPDSVETVLGNAFRGLDSMHSLTLSSSLSDINSHAFSKNKSLVNITFKEGNYHIHYEAFADCNALEHIELPSTMQKIDHDAFLGCDSLNYVVINSYTVMEIEENAFPENVEKFYVRDELYDQYMQSECWSSLTHKLARISEKI